MAVKAASAAASCSSRAAIGGEQTATQSAAPCRARPGQASGGGEGKEVGRPMLGLGGGGAGGRATSRSQPRATAGGAVPQRARCWRTEHLTQFARRSRHRPRSPPLPSPLPLSPRRLNHTRQRALGRLRAARPGRAQHRPPAFIQGHEAGHVVHAVPYHLIRVSCGVWGRLGSVWGDVAPTPSPSNLHPSLLASSAHSRSLPASSMATLSQSDSSAATCGGGRRVLCGRSVAGGCVGDGAAPTPIPPRPLSPGAAGA